MDLAGPEVHERTRLQPHGREVDVVVTFLQRELYEVKGEATVHGQRLDADPIEERVGVEDLEDSTRSRGPILDRRDPVRHHVSIFDHDLSIDNLDL